MIGYRFGMARTVAVTGVSGYVGRTLVQMLERRPDVARIVGIDSVEIPLRTSKLEFHRFDVRDAALATFVEGADCLVHLAFLVEPMRDTDLMRELNVSIFENVLDAVAKTGVGKFVYPSSVYAYGAHADNPVPLLEDTPLRPNAGFAYAEHKAETEVLLDQWQADHPGVVVTVLRPAVVLGPHVDNFMSRAFESPRFVGVRGHAPPVQVLHEQDFAAAVVHFVVADLPGVFNVCADGWIERARLLELLGRRSVDVPADLLIASADFAWRVGLADAPPAQVNELLYPIVMSNARAKATGWVPQFSNEQTVATTVAAHSEHVSFATLRVDRQTLRRASAAAVFGLAAGIAGAGAARYALHRGRSRS
jgi:nucleoside-diphosphate-sugar epimerase